jgi:aminomethyltransferase
LGEDDYLLVINAGTREKDVNWVVGQAEGFDCRVDNLSDNYTQIAIQGPNGVKLLQKLTDVDLSQVKFYWFTHGTVCGLRNTMIARTGYTAEDGFEIYVPSDEATSARVWNEIMEAGREFNALPCGLGARNTLRLEGKLPLYGHEISEEITVWEAGLDRFLKMDKGEFVGRTALAEQKGEGIKRTLVGLENVDRGIPRDGYKVFDLAGKEVGYVTSGSPAPFLKKNIALAYVPLELSAVDTEVNVEIRGQMVKCKVIPTPFYKKPKKA